MSYGSLPRDCWELIGKRCTFPVQFKIAATCIKLRDQFFKHFSLEKWFTFIAEQQYDDAIYDASYENRRGLVDFFISKCNGDVAAYWGLKGALEGGHRDLVDYFICKYKADGIILSWNWALYGAAKGGHRDLVDFFVSMGAWDWNGGLHRATQGGHQDLIDFFISKGALPIT